ncbi:MAG: hypothetical protein JST36_09050 [Bacteroidetes bacterium]|nr:hypothetical protein [Bacteroidota bacterium]
MSLKEHEDFIRLPNGLVVFTAAYLERRGYCCGNGCQNCPYNYKNVPEPGRSILLKSRTNGPKDSEE